MTTKKIMNDWKIPLYKIYTDDEDVNLITKIIKRGTQWAIGPEIEEFENEIKKYVGSDYWGRMRLSTKPIWLRVLLRDNEKSTPKCSSINLRTLGNTSNTMFGLTRST